MYTQPRMGRGFFKKGVLDSSGVAIVDLSEAPLPCTICLRSANIGAKAEYDPTAERAEWITATSTDNSTTMQVFKLDRPMSAVRLTGDPGDHWTIL